MQKILNSNDLKVYLQKEQIIHADLVSYINITINNNIVPIYEQFNEMATNEIQQHYLISGQLGFNAIAFNMIKNLFQLEQQPYKIIHLDKIIVESYIDKIELIDVYIFSKTTTTIVDGSPTQEIYNFYAKDIKFNLIQQSAMVEFRVSEPRPWHDLLKPNSNNVLIQSSTLITDGDTINAKISNMLINTEKELYSKLNSNNITIRVYGVDQPEISNHETLDKYASPYQAEAKKAMEDYMWKSNNKFLLFQFDIENIQDPYNRYVFGIKDPKDLSTFEEYIIQKGYAVPIYINQNNFITKDYLKHLTNLTDNQISARVGIWKNISTLKNGYLTTITDTNLGNYIQIKLTNNGNQIVYKNYIAYEFKDGNNNIFYIMVDKYIKHFPDIFNAIKKKILNNNIVQYGEMFKRNDTGEYYTRVYSPQQIQVIK